MFDLHPQLSHSHIAWGVVFQRIEPARDHNDVQFNTLWYNRRLGTSLSKMTRQHEVEVVPPHEEGKEEEGEKFG